MKSADRPAFSVGVLTHNYGRFIRDALDSVLAQTFRDFECVICDDASTDDTSAIVRPYLADPRFRYVRHERNLRQGGNWAYFLDHAQADRIATLHADDAWEPTALALASAAFDADASLDLVTGRWQKVDGDGRAVGGPIHLGKPHARDGGRDAYLSELRHFSRLPSATFFSRRSSSAAGRPRTDLDMLVDAEFFLRVIAVAGHVRTLSDLVTRYRVHSTGVTTTTARDGRFYDELRRLPEIVATHAVADATTIAAVRERVARELYNAGISAFVGREPAVGRSMIAEAARRWRPLTREPAFAIDRLLSRLGPIGVVVGRRLHRVRFANSRLTPAGIEGA